MEFRSDEMMKHIDKYEISHIFNNKMLCYGHQRTKLLWRYNELPIDFTLVRSTVTSNSIQSAELSMLSGTCSQQSIFIEKKIPWVILH